MNNIFERLNENIPAIDRPRKWGIYSRKPGEENSRVHFHDFDEWYFVLEGKGKVKVGEREFEVEPMQLIFIPAGILHGTLDIYEDYKLLYIECSLQGAGREGHLHPENDEPFDPTI